MFPPGGIVTLHGRPGYGSFDAGTTRGSSAAATDVIAVDTVVDAEPRMPSTEARICAVPLESPETSPVDETEAIDDVALVHVTVLPHKTLPAASFAPVDAFAVLPLDMFDGRASIAHSP